MDAIEQTGSVYALAAAMAKSLPPEELTRAALVFTQLGTTLSVLAALQSWNGTPPPETRLPPTCPPCGKVYKNSRVSWNTREFHS